MLSGGTSTGRGVQDNCDIITALPETRRRRHGTWIGPGDGGCHVVEPWLTTLRGNAVYTIPKVEVLLSAIVRFQNVSVLSGGSAAGTSGPSLSATQTVPNTVVAQSLGRLPSGGLPNGTTSVQLLRPGELYPEQVRTLDVRFAKYFASAALARTWVSTCSICSTRMRGRRSTRRSEWTARPGIGRRPS